MSKPKLTVRSVREKLFALHINDAGMENPPLEPNNNKLDSSIIVNPTLAQVDKQSSSKNCELDIAEYPKRIEYEREFWCPVCYRGYKMLSSYRRHYRESHALLDRAEKKNKSDKIPEPLARKRSSGGFIKHKRKKRAKKVSYEQDIANWIKRNMSQYTYLKYLRTRFEKESKLTINRTITEEDPDHSSAVRARSSEFTRKNDRFIFVDNKLARVLKFEEY